MAVIVVDDSDVRSGENSQLRQVQFGVDVTNGQAVYRSSTDTKHYLALNTASVEEADVAGIVVTPNVADGWGWIQYSGDIYLGANLPVGLSYVLGQTPAGSIMLDSDLLPSELVTSFGIANANGYLALTINASGVSRE